MPSPSDTAFSAPALVVALLLAGCTLAPFEPTVPTADAGRDAGPPMDAGRDAGAPDAGPPDAGPPDACAGPELCNGLDDDCDPETPDGADEPTLGAACDGADADGCEEGAIVCAGGALSCDEAPGDAVESCNATDDDCDGTIDESGCPCEHRALDGSVYLFCTERSRWVDAREECRRYGYDLVTIDDAAEDEKVVEWAWAISMDDWWIGLNDRATERNFEWSSGSTATYRNWATDQPGLFSEDCVQFEDGDLGDEERGRWAPRRCGDPFPYVCEIP